MQVKEDQGVIQKRRFHKNFHTTYPITERNAHLCHKTIRRRDFGCITSLNCTNFDAQEILRNWQFLFKIKFPPIFIICHRQINCTPNLRVFTAAKLNLHILIFSLHCQVKYMTKNYLDPSLN